MLAGFIELPFDVRPAMGESKLGARTGEHFINGVTINNRDAAIVSQDLPAILRRFRRQHPVVRNVGTRHPVLCQNSAFLNRP